MARTLDAHIGQRTFEDPAEIALALFWRARRHEIRSLLETAEALGPRLAAAAPAFVLCHADMHTNNVLLDASDRVWIADWDETMLAPRERDLMFVVGGIARGLVGPGDETSFFEGYGQTSVDPVGLAYYRYCWALSDIASYAEQVFFRPDLGPNTRRMAVDRLKSAFAPGNIVALAFGSRW
jgi:spectinomycin phosphotransferase